MLRDDLLEGALLFRVTMSMRPIDDASDCAVANLK
jgi:hypothetical protein